MDVRRIDKYLAYHFSDDVGDKICIREPLQKPALCEDWDMENFRYRADLQYLEERIDLQETLIYDFADNLGMVNHSCTWCLTERCAAVDEYIHEICGNYFSSPINSDEIDTAEMCYECQPKVYYDIAMTILATKVEDAICELEENGKYLLGENIYYMVTKEGEDDE